MADTFSASPEVSIVVPLFNEQGNVCELVRRIGLVMAASEASFEIICVDDGSTDQTRELLRELVNEQPRLRALFLTRNFGQEPAVQAGMLRSCGRWVVQLDGDLQNPPEQIPKLLAKAREGFAVVYGKRQQRADPWHRRAGSKLLVWCMRALFGVALPDDVSTFRVIDGKLARELAALPEKRKFFSALVGWSGARTTSIPVEHAARSSGRSKYDVFKLLSHSLDLLAGFSFRPLRIIGAVGSGFAAFGILYAAFKVAQKLAGVEIQMGYTSLFSAIVVMGGLNLIAMSVIGEYVGRIFMQTQDRPSFRVEEELQRPLVNGVCVRGNAAERMNGAEEWAHG
ncbi:MAG: glycosyltransferase family 2 protein [Myxococcota bacterium]